MRTMGSRIPRCPRSITRAVGLLLVALLLDWTIKRDVANVADSPHITGLVPPTLPIGSNMQKLTIHGDGFSPFSVVALNGVNHTFNFINSSQISVPLRNDDISRIEDVPITVRTGREAAISHLRVQGGTLHLTISGLPAAQPGSVFINDLDGFGLVLSTSDSIEVPPGTYFVTASLVNRGGASYDAHPASQSITIVDRSSGSLEVAYKKVETEPASAGRRSPTLRWMFRSQEGD